MAGRRVGSERAPYTAEETLPADLAQLVQRLYDDANSFLFAECSSNMKALSFTDACAPLTRCVQVFSVGLPNRVINSNPQAQRCQF